MECKHLHIRAPPNPILGLNLQKNRACVPHLTSYTLIYGWPSRNEKSFIWRIAAKENVRIMQDRDPGIGYRRSSKNPKVENIGSVYEIADGRWRDVGMIR